MCIVERILIFLVPFFHGIHLSFVSHLESIERLLILYSVRIFDRIDGFLNFISFFLKVISCVFCRFRMNYLKSLIFSRFCKAGHRTHIRLNSKTALLNWTYGTHRSTERLSEFFPSLKSSFRSFIDW